MRLSRIIGSAVATLATVGAFAIAGTPAQAQPVPQPPYPPVPPALTVSDATVEVGQTFTVFGTGYGGNELVRLVFTTQPLAAPAPGVQPARQNSGGVGAMAPVARQAQTVHTNPTTITVRANPTGEFSVRVRFTRQLTVTITGTGLTTGRVASTAVTVVRAQPPLPVTGSETGSQLTIGGTLLAAGVLLVLIAVAWRRKIRRTPARTRSRELTPVG
ncbi:LPXTG cell wall anchor domain-containing protein [Micromonospora sp. HM5-17]|jgi:LPXTG-motif cell wall-anchored protein|uniref:LPXTG cell wall anchor domain-containing protein n=1 Tax=Micromonospora sp. HM5-17 TaxID=2487710 RepID=UPI000F471E5A|nr:LPXTG cell wall anchor domain-containing protein [Micromonospora sp. HM5-17]ROT29752.1 LPXTG cell wall anchor domain-containing protein [Micromonospora sp. HM5-17]